MRITARRPAPEVRNLTLRLRVRMYDQVNLVAGLHGTSMNLAVERILEDYFAKLDLPQMNALDMVKKARAIAGVKQDE